MSQYPYPQYPPPPPPPPPPYMPYGGYGPIPAPPDPARPARRAGWAFIAVGTLYLLVGTCFGAVASMISTDQLNTAVAGDPRVAEALASANISLSTLMLIGAVIAAVVGLALMITGIIARRGTRTAVITAMVLGGIITLFATLYLLASIARDATSLLLLGPPTAIMWLALWWLLPALANAPAVEAARAGGQPHYAAQPYAMTAYPPPYSPHHPPPYPPHHPPLHPQYPPPPPPPPPYQPPPFPPPPSDPRV